jgi:Holliday junction resolvase RusA-like endonuclease
MSVLDIPVPPSVNRTRRIDRASISIQEAWEHQCDMWLMASGQYRSAEKLRCPFDLEVILNETMCRRDPDNVLKAPIDYLRRVELIPNDNPTYFRRLVVEWGDAPRGCRLILKAHQP